MGWRAGWGRPALHQQARIHCGNDRAASRPELRGHTYADWAAFDRPRLSSRRCAAVKADPQVPHLQLVNELVARLGPPGIVWSWFARTARTNSPPQSEHLRFCITPVKTPYLLLLCIYYVTDIESKPVNIDRSALMVGEGPVSLDGRRSLTTAPTDWPSYSWLALKKPSMSGASRARPGNCSTPSARRLNRRTLSW